MRGPALYPDELLYTAEHEWLRPSSGLVGGVPSDGGSVRVGITSFAQESLGDIVFVTLPAVGTALEQGQALGEVESTKSVSDVYAPVAGTVSAVNPALEANPELVNSDPYGEGWLLEITVEPAVLDDERLMGAQAYVALIG